MLMHGRKGPSMAVNASSFGLCTLREKIAV